MLQPAGDSSWISERRDPMVNEHVNERCGFTLMMPAWNEQDGVERAVGAALEAGEHLVRTGEIEDFEVLVVDDASTDRTAEILERLGNADSRVRSARHEQNLGLGAAIRTGIANSRGRIVLYTDADLPFDLAELGKAFRIMRHYDADLVAAYRHDRTGEGLRRAVYSYLYNSLVRLVFGLRLRDVNFAAKLMKAEIFDRIELRSDGSFIDVELLARAQGAGFTIVQFGVDYFPRTRGVSTLSSARVIRRIIRDLVTLRREIKATTPRTSR